MKKFLIALALTFSTSASASAAGATYTVKVQNGCDYPVELWAPAKAKVNGGAKLTGSLGKISDVAKGETATLKFEDSDDKDLRINLRMKGRGINDEDKTWAWKDVNDKTISLKMSATGLCSSAL